MSNSDFYIGEEVEVRDWMGGWNAGKVVDILVVECATKEYKVECCGLVAWLRPSDMRKVKR